MPFVLQKVTRIAFEYGPDDDELLGIGTKSDDHVYIRASFDNYPSPTPYIVELDLLKHEGLQAFYDSEVQRLLDAMSPEQRANVDAQGHNVFRLYCTGLDHTKQAFRFVVDRGGEHSFTIEPDEIWAIASTRRQDLKKKDP